MPRARPGNGRVQALGEAGHGLDGVAEEDQRRTAPDEAVIVGPARELDSEVSRREKPVREIKPPQPRGS